MGNYINLSEDISLRIKEDRDRGIINPYAFKDEDVIRRNMSRDISSVLRPAFIRDVEKIIHTPYYNRYSDKTQVFSFQKNDDISRRALHVQLVARIARTIGRALGLNEGLIEAISLGHDIGHTPFGHAGEKILSELYKENTGRLFNHNIHSARVLDTIIPSNLSLQTLDGIICHNGEMELQEYRPVEYKEFDIFDKRMEECYLDQEANRRLIPATLEACVMRISDIIAYLGKDRQDAHNLSMITDDTKFTRLDIGNNNAEIINNMTVNIIENSYGMPYLKMDENFYEALKIAKKENYEFIYLSPQNETVYKEEIKPMMSDIYYRFLKDLSEHNTDSIIYRHHINYVKARPQNKHRDIPYDELPVNDIIVDFIASMTDDYFIDLYDYLFPGNKHKIIYRGYFE